MGVSVWGFVRATNLGFQGLCIALVSLPILAKFMQALAAERQGCWKKQRDLNKKKQRFLSFFWGGELHVRYSI